MKTHPVYCKKTSFDITAASLKRDALANMKIDDKTKAGYYYTVIASDEQRELWDELGFSDTVTYKLFNALAEANTADKKRSALASSGLTKTQQTKYYFAAMASDSQKEKLSQLYEHGVSAEVYYDYLMRALGITGENKKEQIVEQINDMDISDEDKDSLYLVAAQYSESGLKDTPWHNGSLFVLPRIELPKIELPQIELPQITPPQIELPQLPDIFGQ